MVTRTMNLVRSLQQLKYPKEFRIGPTSWPPEFTSALEKLAQILESGGTTTQPPDLLAGQSGFLADVATGLWRLHQKMLQPGTDRPQEEMRKPYRHLQSVLDALTGVGIEIIDHTNQLFDPGMSIKVIAFQPVPGMGREKVIETIKPTVYYKGQPIQMGEVIVGRPQTPDEKSNSSKGDQ